MPRGFPSCCLTAVLASPPVTSCEELRKEVGSAGLLFPQIELLQRQCLVTDATLEFQFPRLRRLCLRLLCFDRGVLRLRFLQGFTSAQHLHQQPRPRWRPLAKQQRGERFHEEELGFLLYSREGHVA